MPPSHTFSTISFLDTSRSKYLRPVTSVRINEFEGGDWAIGGKSLRASDVHALAAGKVA